MCEYCGVQSEVYTLYKYSTFNLELFTNSNIVNGKISLMASVRTLMPDDARLVCRENKVLCSTC